MEYTLTSSSIGKKSSKEWVPNIFHYVNPYSCLNAMIIILKVSELQKSLKCTLTLRFINSIDYSLSCECPI